MNEEIADLLRRNPFVPFVFVLNSGDRYQADNPDLVVIGENVINIMRARSDRRDVLRTNQIAAVEVLDPVS